MFAGMGRSLLTRMEDIGAHGLAGGISSVIGGGKFGAGFFSAGFSEFASPLTLGLNSAYEGAFASAMIGGTASVISGGKFVNGAETGAFSFIFNDWAHAYQQAKAEAKAWVQRIGEAWDQYSDTINLGLNGFAIAGLFVPGVGELEAGAIIAEEALAVDEVKNSVAPNAFQASNLKRFQKKIPFNSKDSVELRELPNGGIAAQATSFGKVPGSKAVYEKQIDVNGKTVQATKTTYDQQGNIVHVKDKLNGGTYP